MTTTETVLLLLTYAELALCTGLALFFATRYSRRPWQRSREGRHLMAMSLTIAGLTGLTLLLNLAPLPLILRLWVSVVAFAVLAWQLCVRVRLLHYSAGRSDDLVSHRRRTPNAPD